MLFYVFLQRAPFSLSSVIVTMKFANRVISETQILFVSLSTSTWSDAIITPCFSSFVLFLQVAV